MSDLQAVVLFSITLIVLSSVVGATVGALISTRRSIEVRPVADEPLHVQVNLTADPVALRVRAAVAEIEPVIIPIVTAPLPSVSEQAARILARFPEAGPTDVAEITGCAKSTASAIITDYKAGFGKALQVVEQ
jgi:hypothetical protein